MTGQLHRLPVADHAAEFLLSHCHQRPGDPLPAAVAVKTAVRGIRDDRIQRGKEPAEEVVSLAKLSHIAVLSTALTMYEASGRLYAAGLHR